MRIGGVDGFPLFIDLDNQVFDGFRLIIPGQGRLQFNEFEAWAGEDGALENVALRRPSNQSSSPVKGHGAAGGNSGRVHTNIGAITDFEEKAWWHVTLDEMTPIRSICLFNRIAHVPYQMDRLQILGHRPDSWVVLFDQANESLVAKTLSGRLGRDIARIENVQAHALTPVLSRLGTDDPEIGPEVLSAWDEVNRLGTVKELLGELQSELSSESTEVAPALLRILRSAATLALPSELVSRTTHSRLIDTSDLERVELFTWGGQEDEPVSAFRPVPAEFQPVLSREARNYVWDHWSPRMEVVQSWPTPDAAYVVDIDGAVCKHPKWELRGVRADGTTTLVYDSLIVSSSATALLQMVATLGLDDFESLDALLVGLELEGKTQSAVAMSRWVQVEDPGEVRFSRSLQEIELRSSFDPGRNPVTRTKHGYKTTHRFMDPVAYAAGTKRLLDLVAAHEQFNFVFPGFGTLLGFIREDGFIPHDDDSDLVVVTAAQNKDEMMELREVLREHLKPHADLKLYDGSKLPGRNMPVGFSQDGQWVHIDLFLTYYEDGELMLFNDRLKSFDPVDPELLTLGRSATIHGVDFNVPKRSEDLLELWYGPKWHTPLTSYLLGYSWQQ